MNYHEISPEDQLDYDMEKIKHFEKMIYHLNILWKCEYRNGKVKFPVWLSDSACIHVLRTCIYKGLYILTFEMSPEEVLKNLQFYLKELMIFDLITDQKEESKEI